MGKSVHVQQESLFTFDRNGCSRWAGIGVQLAREYALGRPLGPNFSSAKNESKAVYGQATYSPDTFDGRLHLTLGARYSDENRKVHRTNVNVNPQVIDAEYDKDFTNFNPSLTVAYDLTDNVNIYGKVMTGFKSGGTAMTSANSALFAQGFDEEEVLSYELGYKSILLDNTLRFNMAIFRTEMDGAQTSVITGASPSARDFLPLDDNVFQGIEFDLEYQLSRSLRMAINYGYLDTETGSNFIDSVVGRTLLIDSFPYAPEHSFSASLNHDVALSNGRLTSALNYSYQDEVFSSVNVNDNSTLPSYSLLGFSATWADIKLGSLAGDFSVQIWGRNILDEEYAIVGTGSWQAFGAAQVDTFGDPRTYGVTLGYSF